MHFMGSVMTKTIERRSTLSIVSSTIPTFSLPSFSSSPHVLEIDSGEYSHLFALLLIARGRHLLLTGFPLPPSQRKRATVLLHCTAHLRSHSSSVDKVVHGHNIIHTIS